MTDNDDTEHAADAVDLNPLPVPSSAELDDTIENPNAPASAPVEHAGESMLAIDDGATRAQLDFLNATFAPEHDQDAETAAPVAAPTESMEGAITLEQPSAAAELRTPASVGFKRLRLSMWVGADGKLWCERWELDADRNLVAPRRTFEVAAGSALERAFVDPD